jgi:ABC-type uncharacterized transport system substrate-binding protein
VLRTLSLCTCCRHYPGAAAGRITSLVHPTVSAFPERVVGSACASSFSRLARRSLTLRPAHSRRHQFVTRYPKDFPSFEGQLRDVQEAARAIAVPIHVLRASTDREIEAAFGTVAQQRIAALAVAADPFFDTRRDKLVALAAHHAVSTMYHFREFAAAGGLVSYGANIPGVYRQIGVYTGRILKGEKPADLPVMQPTKFDLTINLITARALGLDVPATVLARADEVIE